MKKNCDYQESHKEDSDWSLHLLLQSDKVWPSWGSHNKSYDPLQKSILISQKSPNSLKEYNSYFNKRNILFYSFNFAFNH